GPVMVCVFPPTALDPRGGSRWYVSLSTMQGDEYFSEMQLASVGGFAPRRAPEPAPAGKPPAPATKHTAAASAAKPAVPAPSVAPPAVKPAASAADSSH